MPTSPLRIYLFSENCAADSPGHNFFSRKSGTIILKPLWSTGRLLQHLLLTRYSREVTQQGLLDAALSPLQRSCGPS